MQVHDYNSLHYFIFLLGPNLSQERGTTLPIKYEDLNFNKSRNTTKKERKGRTRSKNE